MKSKFMDTTIITLENTKDNIAMLESKGVYKSSCSKRNGIDTVIRYSVKRGVYWFTNKHVAHRIAGDIIRSQVGTIYIC